MQSSTLKLLSCKPRFQAYRPASTRILGFDLLAAKCKRECIHSSISTPRLSVPRPLSPANPSENPYLIRVINEKCRVFTIMRHPQVSKLLPIIQPAISTSIPRSPNHRCAATISDPTPQTCDRNGRPDDHLGRGKG